jgi:hypothetical protein
MAMKTLLPVIVFCMMWQVCFGQEASPQTGDEEQNKEALITSEYQRGYNLHKQQLFLGYMIKGGIATGVTVNSVKITQWVEGQPTGKPNDVQQFTVDFTVYWTSQLHPNDGYTEVTAVYAHQPRTTRPVGSHVVKTNGITRDDVEKFGMKALEIAVLH